MTNLERLISLLGFEPPTNSAEGALLDAGITDSDTYDASSSLDIKKAAVEVMKVLLTSADTGNSMTGFWAKYDREAIEKRCAQLEEETGVTDSRPVIKGKKVW